MGAAGTRRERAKGADSDAIRSASTPKLNSRAVGSAGAASKSDVTLTLTGAAASLAIRQSAALGDRNVVDNGAPWRRASVERPRPQPMGALNQRLWRRKKYRAVVARRIDKVPPPSPIANLKISWRESAARQALVGQSLHAATSGRTERDSSPPSDSGAVCSSCVRIVNERAARVSFWRSRSFERIRKA